MAYKKTVVIEDANVWMSFLIGTKYNDLLYILNDPEYKIVYCNELIKELYESLKKPKIAKYYTKQELNALVRLIKEKAHNVEIRPPFPRATRDPKDDYIVEMAVKTNADIIVSGDKHILELKRYGNTEIMTLSDFAFMYFSRKAKKYQNKEDKHALTTSSDKQGYRLKR